MQMHAFWALTMHSLVVNYAHFVLMGEIIAPDIFSIENDTPKSACEHRISQNAYYAVVCICEIFMHSAVVDNAIFALMDATIAPDIFSHRK